MYLLLPLTILSVFVYIYFYFRASGKVVFVLKTITSILFFTLGLYGYLNNENTAYIGLFLLLGLFFGVLGDCSLGFRYIKPRQKYQALIIGLGMFFVGHVFYSSVLIMLSNQNMIWYGLLTIFITVLFIYITKITNITFGKVQYIVYLYMFVSSIVLSFAFLNFVNNQSLLYSLLFFGALLFIVSDVLLSYIYFKKISHKTMRVIRIVNILVYYFGQILFALSLYFV